jgi:superfamily II DNA or RNA helicase
MFKLTYVILKGVLTLDTKPKGIKEEIYRTEKEYPSSNLIQKLSIDEYVETLTMHAANIIGDKLKGLADEDKYNEIFQLIDQVHDLAGKDEREFSQPLSMITYSENENTIPIKEDLFLTRVDVLYNDSHKIKNFFKTLAYEMQTSDEILFLVSFVRMSGAQLLTRELIELEKRNVPVKILTTTYLNITEAKALRHLLQFTNVEVKVLPLKNESFHTKAYLFKRNSNQNTVIIGSSNISHSALINGHELNVKIPHTQHMPAYEQTMDFFNKMWTHEKAIYPSEEFLLQYEQHQKTETKLFPSFTFEREAPYLENSDIQPNEMQKEALKNLIFTRKNGHTKGVIIAATGTGKTYLSAFDVQQFQPKRLLFIAHREELLDNAIKTYSSLFQDEFLCGKITGSKKEFNKQFIFSTIQSLSKDNTLEMFEPDDFDYIIIDEFHHAEAPTYRKVIDYFKPKFLLGLTATPERMDGRNVLELCDNNIVYEIRLRDALEAELLAPFHYFGVADQTVDYDKVDILNGHYEENSLVRALSTFNRVEFIIDKMKTYGHDGDFLHGLGFCVNIEHAKYMSAEFNKRGYVTECLTGEDSVEYRQAIIRRLEDPQDDLTMIFTVNIFNEGIDIPKVNLMLFLRPTESSTIFIQQLGRGLRKIEDKEYVTVLDFIGNYKKSFIIPLALSGQYNAKAFDTDSLRVAVLHEFADAPGGSVVQLDPIAQREILNRIDNIKLSSVAVLKEMYAQFKYDLGRSPEIIDFLYSEEAPSLNFFIFKFRSWIKTKEYMKDLNIYDEEILEDDYKYEIVERIESMLSIKWPYEYAIIYLAMSSSEVSINNVVTWLTKRFDLEINRDEHETLILRAMDRLSNRHKQQKWSFGEMKDQVFIVENKISEVFNDESYANYVKDRLEYGLIDFRRSFRTDSVLAKKKKLALYRNYTRNELMFIFEAKVPEGTWREGVSRVDNHYLLFINLNKAEDVEDHLLYKDFFKDPTTFHWQSQNKTSHESGQGQEYINHKERDIHIHLFIRKFSTMHGMTLPFMYLGEIDYVSSHGDKPMNIIWKLHKPVPEDLYHDLIR